MEQNHRKYKYTQDEIRQLEEWDKQYVWHPFTQMQDYLKEESLIFSHGEGVYLYDVHGNRYFDGNSSLWVNLHGHNRTEISNAIKAQLDRVAHTTLLGPGNVPSIQLAKRLVDIAPPGLEKVFYSDNGSTAVEVALKMAFQYWRQSKPPQTKRTSYISFSEAYHGDTVGSVSVGGIDLFHGIFGPLLFKRYSAPYPVYSKYTSKEQPDMISGRALEQCEGILKKHKDEIAAVLIEPLVQGAAGILTQAPGFLKGIRELCDRYDVFLIADEVFTGFGHTGKMFACEHENVTPDFLTLAKGISGGYLPLAVTMTTQQVFNGFLSDYSEFRAFFHGHTYTGNQLGCAAALASLDLFEQDKTIEHLQSLIRHFEQKLDELFDRCDRVADIHQIGLIAGIDVCRSRKKQEYYTIEERAGAKICYNLRKEGIWLRPLGNTLVLVPPLISTTQHVDRLLDAIEICINDNSWLSK